MDMSCYTTLGRKCPPDSTRRGWLAALGFGFCMAAGAVQVTVPNADFSDDANNGGIGGGLIGASGSGPIGNGPWDGDYAGVLALLAPPALTIAPGKATISSLGVVALGNSNRGNFNQTLGASYVPAKHYVLAGDLNVGNTLLAIDLLTSGNAGLALTSGASTLASTQGSPSASLSLATNNTYHLALGYDSTASDSGNIGVELFSNPTGVLAADLLSQVTFSNIALTQAPIPALPSNSVLPAGGTPQAASIGTAFSAALVVSVEDAEGNPLEGVTVTFTAPDSGASANLSSTSVMTDVGGRATVTGTANDTAGSYPVVASVDGLGQTAVFDLTNSGAGQPPVTGGIVQGNNGQAATTGSAFSCMLLVQVIDGATPAEGATVVFQAPMTGASATLSDGVNSGSQLIETTNASGFAAVSATANDTAGSYSVTALATALTSGTLAPPVLLATFPMTNLAPAERLFANGFDSVPDFCGTF